MYGPALLLYVIQITLFMQLMKRIEELRDTSQILTPQRNQQRKEERRDKRGDNPADQLGTARSAELDYQEGAFSSLALVICGIITSLIAPFLFPLLIALWG